MVSSIGLLIIGVVLPYVAFGVFVVGIVWRVWTWARSPVPLRVVTTPAPKTVAGVIGRMASEIVLFRSLFRDRKGLWLAAWIFHVSLLIVLVRHLRYVMYPIAGWLYWFQYAASYVGYALLASLFFLLIRHLADEKDVYILALADVFPLVLLICIASTGLCVSSYARTDLLAVKDYMLHLIALRPVAMPAGAMFRLHYVLVMILLIYFPFSKIMHAPGILFSPTRNQRANFEQRFVNPWDPGEKKS